VDKIFVKIIKYTLLFLLIFIKNSYAQSLETILKNSESELISYVYNNQEKFEVQIILTELKKRGKSFTIHKKKFNSDKNNYFYPVSFSLASSITTFLCSILAKNSLIFFSGLK
jgi:hypothetical protein